MGKPIKQKSKAETKSKVGRGKLVKKQTSVSSPLRRSPRLSPTSSCEGTPCTPSPSVRKGKKGRVWLESDDEGEPEEKKLNLFFGGVLYDGEYYIHS